MQTVAVFFGGRSNEREISVITGIYAVNLLRHSYQILPVFLDEQNEMYLCGSAREVSDFAAVTTEIPKKSKDFLPVRLTRGGLFLKEKGRRKWQIDCALNCCHGGLGEGGGLSALLEWHEIVSASPAHAASGVFLDKTLSKIVLEGLKIPVAPYICLREGEWQKDAACVKTEIAETLGYPVIVKPSKLGSSIGITVARHEEELTKALTLCFQLDGAAVIEKYLSQKRDLNCAAYRLGDRVIVSEVEEVFSHAPILSFEEKYEDARGDRTSKLPAEIPQETSEQIQSCLKNLYVAFDLRGIVRADFLLCDGDWFFNELNTVPGTLATYLFGESLLEAKTLLENLVRDAIDCGASKKELIQSGILTRQDFCGKHGRKRPETTAKSAKND